jgi:hypothetical protein
VNTTIEDRLAGYSATLDAAAERHHRQARDAGADDGAASLLIGSTPIGGRPRRRLLAAAVAAVVLVAAVAAWRGLADDRHPSRISTATSVPAPATTSSTTALPPTTVSTPTSGVTPNTLAPTSATAALVPFFTGAATVDQHLKDAAALINSQLSAGADDEPAASAAISAADPATLAHTIPAGLTPQLETAVLVVWSELESRSAALCTPLRTTTQGSSAAHCFTNGTAAAQRFPADLSAAKVLAAQSPAPPTVSPDSHLAGEVAVEISSIDQANRGCGATGGSIFSQLDPITWRTFSLGGITFQGQIGQTAFQATYAPGAGWTARLDVC